MKKIYTIPLISIIFLLLIAFLQLDNITGFVVIAPSKDVVEIKTEEGKFLPAEAIVSISINEKNVNISAEDFIKKTGNDFKREKLGYTGDFSYKLSIAEFGFEDWNKIRIDIIYKEQIIETYEKVK